MSCALGLYWDAYSLARKYPARKNNFFPRMCGWGKYTCKYVRPDTPHPHAFTYMYIKSSPHNDAKHFYRVCCAANIFVRFVNCASYLRVSKYAPSCVTYQTRGLWRIPRLSRLPKFCVNFALVCVTFLSFYVHSFFTDTTFPRLE